MKDNTFRFSQVYALSLPFQILEKEKGKQLLYSIKEELLTNYGLRSLSNKDEYYKGKLDSVAFPLNNDKFMGAIWPSTIGDFIVGCVNYGDIQAEAIELTKIIEHFEQLYKKDCIGYFSEYLEHY